MEKNFEPLVLREEGAALIVTVTRPEALNALNASVMRAFDGVLGWITSGAMNKVPDNIKAMVITGAGEKAFVAGADITEFNSMSPAQGFEFAHRGQQLFQRFEKLSIPVIAAVNGFALGGGLELALACDFIYASEKAKFGLPECTLGIMPGFGGTVRLPRRIGAAKAFELTMTGGMITAEEALRIGLANKVVPADQLMPAVLETVALIASRAPLAIARIKRSVHEGMNLTEDKANELEAKLFGELFGTDDKTEGVKAFMEKRKATFKGK